MVWLKNSETVESSSDKPHSLTFKISAPFGRATCSRRSVRPRASLIRCSSHLDSHIFAIVSSATESLLYCLQQWGKYLFWKKAISFQTGMSAAQIVRLVNYRSIGLMFALFSLSFLISANVFLYSATSSVCIVYTSFVFAGWIVYSFGVWSWFSLTEVPLKLFMLWP